MTTSVFISSFVSMFAVTIQPPSAVVIIFGPWLITMLFSLASRYSAWWYACSACG